MTKRRTAQQIRAYCEAATDGEWTTAQEGPYWPIAVRVKEWEGSDCEYMDLLSVEAGNAENDADFCVNARTDLPDVLDRMERYRDAAVKLREVVNCFADVAGLFCGSSEVLAETAWLAEPEPAPADGDEEGEA